MKTHTSSRDAASAAGTSARAACFRPGRLPGDISDPWIYVRVRGLLLKAAGTQSLKHRESLISAPAPSCGLEPPTKQAGAGPCLLCPSPWVCGDFVLSCPGRALVPQLTRSLFRAGLADSLPACHLLCSRHGRTSHRGSSWAADRQKRPGWDPFFNGLVLPSFSNRNKRWPLNKPARTCFCLIGHRGASLQHHVVSLQVP